MDALHRAVVDGFLNFRLRCPRGVDNLRKVVIIQLKNFRADFHTNPAGNAFVLIYTRELRHDQATSFSPRISRSLLFTSLSMRNFTLRFPHDYYSPALMNFSSRSFNALQTGHISG